MEQHTHVHGMRFDGEKAMDGWLITAAVFMVVSSVGCVVYIAFKVGVLVATLGCS